MSDRLQFEYHPDADQISAFVEHALPAHEREQMLDHLAVCPECRAVVALSLPSVEEPAKPLPASARKPWWRGWMIAWPAAAAIAALALIVIYIHHAGIAPKAPALTEIAGANPPARPAPQGPSPTLSAAPALRGAQPQPARSSREASASGAGGPAEQNHGIVVSSQNIAGPAIKGRNAAPMSKMAQAPPTPSPGNSGQSVASGTGYSGGLGAGVGGGIAKAPSAVADARLQKAVPVEPAAAAVRSAPAPTSTAAMAPPGQSSETVVVTSAAPIATVSSDVGNIAIAEDEAQITQLEHPLPSRLPILSMATQERRIVAIDTRNAVFLSKDGGKHWKAIPVQWPGRAVKADLVVFPVGSPTGYGRDKTTGTAALTAGNSASAGSANGALVVQGRALKELSGSSLSGTVTDPTGAVIPGAAISVTDSAAHTVSTVKTDGDGRYVVDGLAPGAYRVEAQAPGFNKQVLAAVAVTASRPTVQNLSLAVGAATESVMVETESTTIPVSKKTKTKSVAATQASPVFAITTDNGERWTSTDGVTWKQM
jgi:hypothetical protein